MSGLLVSKFYFDGSHKRPTFDNLILTQWVAGFVRCIQEKSEAASACMLDYLGNFREDASDFSITVDKYKKMEQIRRDYAQTCRCRSKYRFPVTFG